MDINTKDQLNKRRLNMKMIDSSTIESLTLVTTEGYQQMYYRPYAIHATADTLGPLYEMKSRVGLGSLNPKLVSETSSNLITLGDVDAATSIPNNWETSRFKFTLRTSVTYHDNTVEIVTLQGYTDRVGMSNSGHLDPNMLLYINSCNVVAGKSSMNHVGNQNISSNQVLLSGGSRTVTTSGDSTTGFGEEVNLQRPQDIFVGISTEMVNESLGTTNGMPEWDGFNDNMVINTTNNLGNNPQFSKRGNQLPGKYLADLLNTYGLARSYTDMNTSDELVGETTIGAAHGLVQEDVFTNNAFIAGLYDGMMHGRMPNGAFSLKDLTNAYPGLLESNRVQIINNGNRESHESDYHDGNDMLSQLCYSTGHQVTGLLSRCSLSDVSFVVATVLSIEGHNEYKVSINAVDSIANVNKQDATHNFKMFLESELIPYITNNGMYPITLSVRSSIFTDTAVMLSVQGLNNDQPKKLLFPTFADNTYTPVLTTDTDGDISSHMRDMLDFMTTSSDVVVSPTNTVHNNTSGFGNY